MMMIGPNQLRRLLMAALAGVLFMVPLNSIAGGNNAQADTLLVILQPEDAVVGDMIKLRELSLSGNNYAQDCAYYELLLKAKEMAIEAGANLLKINARTNHSRAQRCDGIEVAFYQSADPRGAEQSFTWNAARPLSWDDFRGPVRAGTSDHIAAETSCGIAIETNFVPAGSKAKVYVFNTFDKRTSWVRAGEAQPGVLEHEQGHWDICELYTRKMQARFDKMEITGAALNRKVNEVFNEVSREYRRRQEQYEQDTQHGTIPEAQQRWTRLIAEELNQDMTGRL